MKPPLRLALASALLVLVLLFAQWCITRTPDVPTPPPSNATEKRTAERIEEQKTYEHTQDAFEDELDAVRAYRQKLDALLREVRALAPALLLALAFGLALFASPRAHASDLVVPTYRISLDGSICFGPTHATRLLHTAQQAPALRLELNLLEADRRAANEEIRILTAMHHNAEEMLHNAWTREQQWQRVERQLRQQNAQLTTKLAKQRKATSTAIALGLTALAGVSVGVLATR